MVMRMFSKAHDLQFILQLGDFLFAVFDSIAIPSLYNLFLDFHESFCNEQAGLLTRGTIVVSCNNDVEWRHVTFIAKITPFVDEGIRVQVGKLLDDAWVRHSLAGEGEGVH